MKKIFTTNQILSIIEQYNTGKKVTELAFENKISPATFYVWNNKYSQLTKEKIAESEIKRIKELEEENGKLKLMYVELAIDNRGLKEHISKKNTV